MATKVKGFLKGGMKHVQDIFVVKEEHEMEIGLPTDVKHVAHIGIDGGTSVPQESPSWMNETHGNGRSREPSPSRENEERPRGGSRASPSKSESDSAPSENQKAPKKKRRKHRDKDSSSRSSAPKPSRKSKVKVSAQGDNAHEDQQDGA